MLARALRLAVLLGVAVAAAGSASSSNDTPSSQWPRAPQNAQGWYCHGLTTDQSRTSLCYTTSEQCEQERQASIADGARTTGCGHVDRVACFAMAGSTDPTQEICSGTMNECEVWRQTDQAKNGGTDPACTLKP